MSVNRNKKSFTLNLKKNVSLNLETYLKEAREVLYDLVSKSDVVLENLIPGKTKEMGFDYETLKKIKPDLIYASITGFGTDHKWSTKPAFDLTIQAMSGLMNINGPPEGPPYKVGYAITDVLSGHTLYGGILSAILHKERTGEG